MHKGRLEAFSDGVIAIIITIMVLELKVPHGESFAALKPTIPVFLMYVLSYVYVGIYWNNHHHMLHACGKVTGVILWANLHLLFWLSLIPFTTAWMDENHFTSAPSDSPAAHHRRPGHSLAVENGRRQRLERQVLPVLLSAGHHLLVLDTGHLARRSGAA
jgi:hypothetical protein